MNNIERFSRLIHDRRAELEAYGARPDSKKGYIDKENRFLGTLAEIHEGLPPLQRPDLWLMVESEWNNLSSIDANHSGIQIQLFSRPKCRILCNLPINLYEYGI